MHFGRVFAIFIALTAAPLFAREAASAAPSVEVTPERSLTDAPLVLRVRGFAPDAAVTVAATQPDSTGHQWRAERTLRTDSHGNAVIRDAGRLIAAMTPANGSSQPYDAPDFKSAIEVTFSASGGGNHAASVVEREQIAPSVNVTPVDSNGVKGLLFVPGGKPKAAVVVLGGSEGGEPRHLPALLSSHGFEVLSLAYFGEAGLPKSLVNIPVETVLRGIAWLASQPRVPSGRIFVEGDSRGGELAILAALHSRLVRGVVALVPTPIVAAGLEFGKGPVDQSPWTIRAQPVPYITFATWTRYQTTHDERLIDKAILPLDRLKMPLLIVAGDDDRLAFSAETSRIAIRHARELGASPPVTLLAYPDAGHLIEAPFQPTANRSQLATPYGLLKFGGPSAGYAAADADSWPRILRFLSR